MKLNIHLTTKPKVEELNLEQRGLISVINEQNNKGIIDFKEKYSNLNISNFIDVINSLIEKNILDVNVEQMNNQILIDITNEVSDNKERTQLDIRLLKAFNLTEEQLENILEDSQNQTEAIALKIFSRYPKNNIYDSIEINSEEDYIKYIEMYSPLEILKFNNKYLNVTDIQKLYEFIMMYDFELSVFSIVFDYAISTSIYKNINYNFVSNMLMGMANNSVITLKDAHEYIKEALEKKQEVYNNFIEPNYDTQVINDVKIKEEENLLNEEKIISKEYLEVEDDFLSGEIDFD